MICAHHLAGTPRHSQDPGAGEYRGTIGHYWVRVWVM